MARLIDAEKLNFHCNYNGDCSGDVSHCKECDNYVLDYRDIQEQPTAYSVEKVVEQLENDEKYTFDGCINKRHAIEIVKGGGVNE